MLMSGTYCRNCACKAARSAVDPSPEPASVRATTAPALLTIAVALAALTAWVSPLRAGPVSIPNASFESPMAPANPGALPTIDSWQQSPTWDNYLSGVFLNAPSPYYVYNGDGNQAASPILVQHGNRDQGAHGKAVQTAQRVIVVEVWVP